MSWSAPAEKHISLSDTLFTDGTEHWDFQEQALTGNQLYAMNPRGIIIGNERDGDYYAKIVGCLKGEGANNLGTFRLAVGVVHPLCFSHIVMAGTTGRNIKILGS